MSYEMGGYEGEYVGIIMRKYVKWDEGESVAGRIKASGYVSGKHGHVYKLRVAKVQQIYVVMSYSLQW